MRNRIFGLIGMLWGGGIVLAGLLRGPGGGDGAYQGGHIAGYFFGFVMFVVGFYYLVKGSNAKATASERRAKLTARRFGK